MDRFPRLVAVAAMLLGVAAWAVAPPAVSAQSDVVIELNFETEAGQPPAGGVAVLDVNSGTEYRNDAVAMGQPIEIAGASGVSSVLQVRRTELQPAAVSCEGADDAKTVTTSRGVTVVITPGADQVVCTITLSDDLPPNEDLAVTGLSGPLTSVGVMWLGAGALMAAVARSAQADRRSR